MTFNTISLTVLAIICIGLLYITWVEGTPAQIVSASTTRHPVFQPTTSTSYIPHKIFPDAESFPDPNPARHYLQQDNNGVDNSYSSVYSPPILDVVHYVVRFTSTVWNIFVNGASLIVLGGLILTTMCTLTPFCEISFNGLSSIYEGSARSLMSPDQIATAAALVQDAIGKYNRLQRSANNN